MKRLLFFFIYAAAAIAGAGCGNEEVEPSHRDLASEALLSAEDLPGKVKIEGGLPSEPCGPSGIFKDSRGRSAETKMFNFQGIRTQEAVGVFPSKALADVAYSTLISREHQRCIANAIVAFGRPGDTVELLPRQKLTVGDESAQFGLRIVSSEARERGMVVAPAIRSGRCVSALFVFTKNSADLDKAVARLASQAAQALTSAC